jgi:hypothetical protein
MFVRLVTELPIGADNTRLTRSPKAGPRRRCSRRPASRRSGTVQQAR